MYAVLLAKEIKAGPTKNGVGGWPPPLGVAWSSLFLVFVGEYQSPPARVDIDTNPCSHICGGSAAQAPRENSMEHYNVYGAL